MRRTLLKLAASLVGSVLATTALAEDLRLVGSIEPIGLRIYADHDSISRRAHIARITAIAIPDPSRKAADTLPFIFDCDEGLYYLPDGKTTAIRTPFAWQKNGSTYSLSPQTIPSIFSIACKRSWELWK